MNRYSNRRDSASLFRKQAPARLFSVALTVCALFGTTACGGGNELQPELVPGTERIKPHGNGPWFTISPDEQWLAYAEVDSADWDIRPTDRPPRFHLVTMEMGTLIETHHHLEDIPADVFPEQLGPWLAVMGGFQAPSWLEGRLFVRVLGSSSLSPWIVFVPGVPRARRVSPTAEGTCLDCPPTSEWRRLMAAHGITYDWPIHAAYTDGRFSNMLYLQGRAGRGVAAIDRMSTDGETERLLVLKRRFKKTSIGAMRVSPNERYLAYTLGTNLRSAIPLPTLRDEVHVLDLHARVDRRVPGSFRVSGNLMWSQDSSRLYYTVVDGYTADGHRDGVYCISFPSEQ